MGLIEFGSSISIKSLYATCLVKASILSGTTCSIAPIVCASTCFVGCGIGLTGVASSLTAGNAYALCGCVPSCFANASHLHGNINNGGCIGTTSGCILATSTNGCITVVPSTTYTNCTGTVTSVTAGNGMTQSGTASINPTLDVVSAAGTAGSVGLVVVAADSIGVCLGTGSCHAAAGDHAHGNITTGGCVGSVSGCLLATTTNGCVTTLASTTYAPASHAHGCITSGGCMSGAASGCVLCTTTSGCITYYTLPAYTTCTGTVTSVAVNAPLTGSTITTSGTFGIRIASGTQSGALSSTDWTTFNSKTTCVGTVTSVTAGNGMTQSGTASINPTLDIVSHAGSAGSIGTINIGADAIGVNLGTTNITAAAGDHAHGCITTGGCVGSTSGCLLATTTSGCVTVLPSTTYAAAAHAHGCITTGGCMSGAASGCVLCTTTSGCITYYTLPAYTTCTGTVTSVAVNAPLTGSTITTSGTFGIRIASGTQSGALSSTDWTTFNNKTTCVGTVTSVTAGNGMTQSGTASVNPTLDVVSAAGSAGSVGLVVVAADSIGVCLGTGSCHAAAGDHAHGCITTGGCMSGAASGCVLCTTTSGCITYYTLPAYTTCTGTVTSVTVTAGNGMTGGGTITTSGTVTLDVTSAAGSAGSVGLVVVAADSIGVCLGTGSCHAAAGDHAHGCITTGGCMSGAASGCVLCTTTSGCITYYTLPAYTTCVGTVTSVTAGNGMTQSGTASINPTLDVVSHAGSANAIGTLCVTADSVGVCLGTTNITAAAGSHAHGCITNTGCMSGAASGCVLCTTTSGCITYFTLPAYTTCTGTVTSVAVNAPLTGSTITTSGTFGIRIASGTQSGALSSTDWTTFNSKTTCVGTVTSVTAGNGMTQSGTASVNPTLDVVSAAGTAGSVGLIVVAADSIGVCLGTGSCHAAAGDHNHSSTYAPLSHTHGNINNGGCIGSAAGCVVCTTTSGCLTTFTLPAYTTCTGTVTSVAVNSPLTGSTITTSGTFGIQKATSSQNGYLSSGDWTTFNNKTSCVGTVTSITVTAGNGMTGGGTVSTSGTVTLDIVSHAGSAGSIGTVNIGTDSIGVNLGSTSITAAAGDHNHGCITNTGFIGSTAGCILCTGTGGCIGVMTLSAGGLSTANNGLTVSGTNVRLGGALTGNTTITGAYTLNICNGAKLNTRDGYQISGTTVFRTVSTFDNIYIGRSGSINAASNNIAIGECAFISGNATANANVAIGGSALRNNTSGTQNTAIGLNALQANLIGSSNVGIGVGALLNNTSGCNNYGIGYAALGSNTIGSNNIAVGYYGLWSNVSGSHNMAFGCCAGYNETGSGKLFIATGATRNLIYGDFSTNIVTLPSLCICTTPPSGAATDCILTWNSTDKRVKTVCSLSMKATGMSYCNCVAYDVFAVGDFGNSDYICLCETSEGPLGTLGVAVAHSDLSTVSYNAYCSVIGQSFCLSTDLHFNNGSARFICFPVASAGVGHSLVMQGNTGAANNTGGIVSVVAGTGGATTGTGGILLLCGGAGGATTGAGGAVCIAGGVGGAANCGQVCIFSGAQVRLNTTTTGVQVTGCLDTTTCMDIGTCLLLGTNIVLTTGAARTITWGSASSTSGYGFIVCGQTGAANTNGGDIQLVGGVAGATSGTGGVVSLYGGAGTAGAGGPIRLIGGDGNSSGAGGAICICGGCGVSSGAGGMVYIYGGTGAGGSGCVVLGYGVTAKMCTVTNGICLAASSCGFGTDWIATSDIRLKTNIVPISNALSMVVQLQGVCYNLCNDCDCENRIGLIAQEVDKILPEVVSHSLPDEEDAKYGITDDKLGLKYDKLTAVLIEAIKEQQTQINYLTAELNYIKSKTN